MMMRLNKFIADAGITSRRKSEEFILQGRISVNNKIIMDLSYKVDENNDEVYLDGEKISTKRKMYLLMNKPKGVITSTEDEKNRKTVVDLIKVNERIYPIGRLDYNTTGVLILTNDGEFKNLLTHPKNHVPREYEVTLDRILSEEDKAKMLKGIYLDGKKGKFIKIKSTKNRRILIVECIEGRNHFVKNMFGVLGYTVQALNRKSFAGLTADIPVGSYRKLSGTEINNIVNKYAS
jgi:23S rRNA pseudouridine2605 synthase